MPRNRPRERSGKRFLGFLALGRRSRPNASSAWATTARRSGIAQATPARFGSSGRSKTDPAGSRRAQDLIVLRRGCGAGADTHAAVDPPAANSPHSVLLADAHQF